MTAQIHEHLILDGREASMAFCPALPMDDPRVVERGQDDSDSMADRFLNSTACWRRYQGTWEIKNGKFYLVRLQGRFRLTTREPILADWFSGVLRIPQGERLQYVHMGFGSVYEGELHIKIENGVVVGRREVDNRNKPIDKYALGLENLPGLENRFEGDDEF